MITDDIDGSLPEDHSTATEWEIFISRLEEIIRLWKLPLEKVGLPLKNNDLSTGEWEIKTEFATFADTEFIVSFHKLKQEIPDTIVEESDKLEAHEDLLSLENDFLSMMLCEDGSVKPHYIARWYGLKKFVVLTPTKGSAVMTESKVKILMSSMTIAINNCNCEVPIFAQVLESWQNYFIGVCEGKGFRSEFDMIHLKRIPPHCRYLSGLLSVFKSKIACSATLDPIQVSARFSYQLSDWTQQFVFQTPLPDFQELSSSLLEKLPFGTVCEPLTELTLYATWPKLVDTVIVDTENYSDLEPLQAPLWYLAIKMTDQPSSLLYDHLFEFLMLCNSNVRMEELIGDLLEAQPCDARIGAKSRLKESSCLYDVQGPLSDDILMPILEYLFPDAVENSKNNYSDEIGCLVMKQDDVTQEGLGGLKTSPPDGIVWRLAICMAHALYSLGGVKSLAHVWFEFVQELRYRWENSIRIPGVAETLPDLKTCLINQKLQLLNCCINKKIARQEEALSGSVKDNIDDQEEDGGGEEDEFFDCDEEVKVPLNQPTGRLRKHSDYKLMESGAPLFIPITQDPVPKTEDQIEEYEQLLLSLGSDPESSVLRAQMMSASLRSDMESFKAANPGAVLEDFIRWYSPRDFIETSELDKHGQKKGTLSARMNLPGNTWREVWETAKAVPARRQKRLFDDTVEAEKIIHHFECLQPYMYAQLLVPVIMHAAVSRVLEATYSVPVPSLKKLVAHIKKRVEYVTRCPDLDLRPYQEICTEIGQIEAIVSQYHSLHSKLSPDANDPTTHQFLADLITSPSSIILVPDDPEEKIRKRLSLMFFEAQKVASMRLDSELVGDNIKSTINRLPPPNSREFILRVVAPRPAPSSRPTPQKLTTVVYSPDTIIMSGCFTQDTMFQ